MLLKFEQRFGLPPLADVLCSAGLRGCELHIRSGYYTPLWRDPLAAAIEIMGTIDNIKEGVYK